MKYKLVFEDTFENQTILDDSKWSFDLGADKWGNREEQCYTKENVCIKDNKLHITAKEESCEGKEYTSGRITTYGTKSIQYGKIEVSAKMPAGSGTWPAIWMLPNSFKERKHRWPQCGEIDIMEHIGRNENEIHFSLHTQLYNHIKRTQFSKFLMVPNVTTKFIKYAIEWTPEYIEFFLDDISYFKVTKGQDNSDTSFDGWPFDQEFYLIINLAVGGSWGGYVDKSNLPVSLIIDYVRMYQLET